MRIRSQIIAYLIGSPQMIKRFRTFFSLTSPPSCIVTIVLDSKNLQVGAVASSPDQVAKLRPNIPCFTLIITDTVLDKKELWGLCRKFGPCPPKPQRTAMLRVVTKFPGEISISANCPIDDFQTIISLLRRNLELTYLLLKEQSRVKSISSMANRDPLTGLANRRGWKVAMKRLWREALENSRFLLVALFDLDGFKKVNDQFGHAFGDQVLKSVAKKAQEACREGDLLARWGGDEMALAVLLPDKSLARQIVERIRSSLQSVFPPMDVPVTASAGYVVALPKESWNDRLDEQLLKSADAALAQAKTSQIQPVCEGTVGLSPEQEGTP